MRLVAQRLKARVVSIFIVFVGFTCAYATPNVYVGAVEESDALVALVVEDGQILGYTCGGNQTWSTHSSWFPVNDESVLGDGSFKLIGANGHSLQGLYTTDAAEGTLTLPDGTSLAWSAEVAAENTPAGLYKLNEVTDETQDLLGFIVANDLKTVGNIRHILPRRSTTVFAPVGLAQALPDGTAESVTVCFTLEATPTCKSLPRALEAKLE